DSDESFSCTPEEIVKAASTATSNLLPEKSKGQYLKEYDLFMKWRAEKQVALIFGIAGALRREELYKMTLEDINDTGTVLIITIPDSKTHIGRRFTIVGTNTFSKIPSIVAKYLSLPNPDHYTGHPFRRSSASLLVDSGGDLIQLKKHGGWKSNAVAEGYVDESIQNKMDCANKIFTGG
ncbi:hypothetical protein ILUMI_16174, partial [Ignelater luminosus]